MTTRSEVIDRAWAAYLENLDAGPQKTDRPGDFERRITVSHLSLRTAFKLPVSKVEQELASLRKALVPFTVQVKTDKWESEYRQGRREEWNIIGGAIKRLLDRGR